MKTIDQKRHFAGYLNQSGQKMSKKQMAELFESFKPFLTEKYRYVFVYAAAAGLCHKQLIEELRKLDNTYNNETE